MNKCLADQAYQEVNRMIPFSVQELKEMGFLTADIYEQ